MACLPNPFKRLVYPFVGNKPIHLVESLRWAHGSLDGQASNVLPSLLQQTDQVVDRQHDVTNQLVLGHANVSNSDTQAKHLLQLELDSRLDFGDLCGKIFSVGNWCWEFTSFGQTRTEKTRDLLDQAVGGEEGVVLAGEFLNQFLVLVELLQVVGGHCIDAMVLASIDIVLITKNADGHSRSGDLWQLDSTRETLVTLRVVVLQADLEFDSLEEVALLLILRVIEQLLHILAHSGCGGQDQLAVCRQRHATKESGILPTVIFDMMTVFQKNRRFLW